MMETAFTPLASLTCDVLIGIASTLLMLLIGRIMGVTGILAGLFQPSSASDLAWRATRLTGMIAGPAVVWLASGEMPAVETPMSTAALVIGGALVTTLTGYRLVFGRSAPLFEPNFNLPGSRDIDAKLVGGSAIFGIGWGISGFCPGGALPAFGTSRREVFAFTIALVAGIFLARLLPNVGARQEEKVARIQSSS